MMSVGPSPTTWYAICTPSDVFAYRVSGMSTLASFPGRDPAATGAPEQEGASPPPWSLLQGDLVHPVQVPAVGTPFSSCSPASSNVRPDPATRSFTVEETSTSEAPSLCVFTPQLGYVLERGLHTT